MPPKRGQSLELDYEPFTDDEKLEILKRYGKPKTTSNDVDIDVIVARKVEEALKTKTPTKKATDKQLKHLAEARAKKAMIKKGVIPKGKLQKQQVEVNDVVDELYDDKRAQTGQGRGIRKPVVIAPRTYTPRMDTIEDIDEDEPQRKAESKKKAEEEEMLSRWAGTFGFR